MPKAKQPKPLLPRIATGGYSVRFRFMDEARGERFFDAEYGVGRTDEPNEFRIFSMLDWRGFNVPDKEPVQRIAAALTPGTVVSVHVTKHNRRGRWPAGGRLIQVIEVLTDAQTGVPTVRFSNMP